MEIRELLSSYDFPSDDIVIKGSRAGPRVHQHRPERPKANILELMDAVDEYIRLRRKADLPFLMPVRTSSPSPAAAPSPPAVSSVAS
ncbi:MAG: hypothetical protein ACLVL7_09305 [Anaerotruncus massiliensis (ex Togo et al. 2019)]